MTDKIEIETIKAGMILTISTGDYSCYSVHGVFRALKDITQEDYESFNVANTGYFDPSKVLAKMATLGYIEDVESTELHLGGYETLLPEIYERD